MKKPPRQPDPDAENVRELFRAIVKGGPRGTLTRVGDVLGLSASAALKRLTTGGFDAATMRAMIIAEQWKANPADPLDELTVNAKQVGPFIIDQRADGRLNWRLAP